MATIEIVGWKKDFVGFTGWDDHAKAELRKRLRRGVKASPSDLKRLARRINSHETLTLSGVHEEAVASLTQILETTGADLRISLEGNNKGQLFKKIPLRGRRLEPVDDTYDCEAPA